jgi:hypothetical protein
VIVLTVKEEMAFRKVDGRLVVVNLQSGFYYSLNETATLIFELIRQRKDIPEVLQALCDTYEVPADAALRDLQECLETLVTEQLLVQSRR